MDDVAPLRLAIAGCGRISELGYVPALRRVPELRLCAVADPDRGRRERLARLAGVGPAPFGSVAEMVRATSPDAVVVASPPELHLEHAEALTVAAEQVALPVVLQISENTVAFHGSLAPVAAATRPSSAGASCAAL